MRMVFVEETQTPWRRYIAFPLIVLGVLIVAGTLALEGLGVIGEGSIGHGIGIISMVTGLCLYWHAWGRVL